jgi:hypothetical protein
VQSLPIKFENIVDVDQPVNEHCPNFFSDFRIVGRLKATLDYPKLTSSSSRLSATSSS